MKTVALLLALVALVAANNVLVDNSKLKCFVCEMMVQDSDKWLGKEGQKDEAKAIQYCENLLKNIGQTLGEVTCNASVKHELDNVSSFEEKEAGKVCHKLNYC